MKKKMLSLLLCLVLSTLTISGCNSGNTKGGGDTGSQNAEESTTESEVAEDSKEEAKPTEEVAEPEETVDKDLVILYTSDVHCGVDEGFGYAGLAAIKNSIIAAGNNVLLVDDGDSIQGKPIGTLSKGDAIIDLMNKVGYDLAIPGNHEFDYGMEQFMSLTKKANFPYISCNFNKDGSLVFEPYIIKEVGKLKVGFVGITTPKTLTSSTPKYFQDDKGNYIYGFMQDEKGEKLYGAVQDAVDKCRADGAEYVIAVSHLGSEAECEPYTYADVLSNTKGINVLFDGHSHDTDEVLMKNKDGEDVLRVACGTKLACVGWLRIAAEDGALSNGLYTWNNKVSAPELLGIENQMSQEVKAAKEKLEAELNKVVAKTEVKLTINDPEAVDNAGQPIRMIRRAETNLGNLCADAYLDQSGADIALINGGGIRAEIDKGDITYGAILNVHPFGNALTVIEATGQQILDALEWGARALPDEQGGFLHPAGLTYEIDAEVKSSCKMDENGGFTGVSGKYRVKNVMVDGKPLDTKKTYTVASIDYIILGGGDGYTMFKGCNVLQNAVKLDNQVLIDYISETLGGVIGADYENPYGQGRIVIHDAE